MKRLWDLIPRRRAPSLRTDLQRVWNRAYFRAFEDELNGHAPPHVAKAVNECAYVVNLDALRTVVDFVRSDAEVVREPRAAAAAERVSFVLEREPYRLVEPDFIELTSDQSLMAPRARDLHG